MIDCCRNWVAMDPSFKAAAEAKARREIERDLRLNGDTSQRHFAYFDLGARPDFGPNAIWGFVKSSVVEGEAGK